MRALLYLAFAAAALLGSFVSALMLPSYRRRLTVLREARQITPADAERKLRSFIFLIIVWFVLGMTALASYFQPNSPWLPPR